MVYTGLEKSLKIETLHMGYPWKKITFVKKRVLCKGKIESTAVRKFYWWSWKCVCLWFQSSCHSSFSIILKYPRNGAFLGEGNAIIKPPPATKFWRSLPHVMLCQLTGRKSPRNILFLEKSLIIPPKFCMNHASGMWRFFLEVILEEDCNQSSSSRNFLGLV